jgi:YHS domain-containing protein
VTNYRCTAAPDDRTMQLSVFSFEPFIEKDNRFLLSAKSKALNYCDMWNRRLFMSLPVLFGRSLFAYGQGRNPRSEKARDPVCGLPVEKNLELSANYRGRIFYFCSIRDREEFKRNPQKYVR